MITTTPTRMDRAITAAQSAEPRQLWREQSYLLHAVFNRVSSTSSGANCDRSRRGGDQGVGLQKTYTDKGVRASWSKQSCGSRLCPRCSVIASYLDRRKLQFAVEQHTADGGMTLFLTFTARTAQTYTPRFANAEYTFRRDRDVFNAFREADKDLPRKGSRARLKQAAEQYGLEHGIPTATHEDWELNRRLNAFRHVLSRQVFSGVAWNKDREQFGIKGRVDAIELVPQPAVAADGGHDWNLVAHNLHIHAVVFLKGRLNEQERDVLAQRLITRWTKGLRARGFTATKTAQDSRWIAAEDVEKVMRYVTKFSDEVVFGKGHRKDTSLSVWDALRESDGGRLGDDGHLIPADYAARNWFRQTEQVFNGRRMFNTSIRFFEEMGVAELIKQQEEEWRQSAITETVLTFSGGTWMLICEDNPELKYELLNIAENTAIEDLYAYVDEVGYGYEVPATPTLTLDELPDDEPF